MPPLWSLESRRRTASDSVFVASSKVQGASSRIVGGGDAGGASAIPTISSSLATRRGQPRPMVSSGWWSSVLVTHALGIWHQLFEDRPWAVGGDRQRDAYELRSVVGAQSLDAETRQFDATLVRDVGHGQGEARCYRGERQIGRLRTGVGASRGLRLFDDDGEATGLGNGSHPAVPAGVHGAVLHRRLLRPGSACR